eukprot:gnl/MRDRNA2_/MRDRNA2_114757_c0_seq1.p1 gnl/MRDRNA2_/MRDRNA2_114757_c0~~gnl/MRDRNA2_/MRDRNA2_114757_c0_seq1.p1  ORF type:complete len:222 (+),score=51.02 gnl/MRDRNA2_/MRDRNA2_114757_c0_seq1:87-668(+)
MSVSLAPSETALPKGLEGSMDGEKVPMNRMEEMQQALEPYHKKYGHYLLKIKPWREFLAIGLPAPGQHRARLESNLVHFQMNYAVLFLVLMVVSIILNPKCLFVISILVLCWMWFLKKNDDPNWTLNVGGVELGKTQRWMGLSAITALVLLSVVGNVIFSAAFGCAILVAAHGVLHPVADGDGAPAQTLDPEV